MKYSEEKKKRKRPFKPDTRYYTHKHKHQRHNALTAEAAESLRTP
jgi:hypothetical protein